METEPIPYREHVIIQRGLHCQFISLERELHGYHDLHRSIAFSKLQRHHHVLTPLSHLFSLAYPLLRVTQPIRSSHLLEQLAIDPPRTGHPICRRIVHPIGRPIDCDYAEPSSPAVSRGADLNPLPTRLPGPGSLEVSGEDGSNPLRTM